MESSKLVADDNKHAKWLPRVLDLGQEVRSKTEAKGNLGWLIKVGFEDMFVED